MQLITLTDLFEIFLCLLSFVCSFIAVVKVLAFEKSTHTVQYITTEQKQSLEKSLVSEPNVTAENLRTEIDPEDRLQKLKKQFDGMYRFGPTFDGQEDAK